MLPVFRTETASLIPEAACSCHHGFQFLYAVKDTTLVYVYNQKLGRDLAVIIGICFSSVVKSASFC